MCVFWHVCEFRGCSCRGVGIMMVFVIWTRPCLKTGHHRTEFVTGLGQCEATEQTWTHGAHVPSKLLWTYEVTCYYFFAIPNHRVLLSLTSIHAALALAKECLFMTTDSEAQSHQSISNLLSGLVV